MQASLKASERVGWAWHARAKSSELAPYSMPITASEIISPAPGPIIWAPKILSVFLSAKTLTIPSVLEIAFARELAKNGKTPLVYSTPKNKIIFTLLFKLFFCGSHNGNFRVSINN